MAIKTNADVARRVRGVAAETRTTQAALAEALGVSRMSIHRRLTGVTPFVAGELIEIAELMGTSVDAFFTDTTERAA